jgi:hypothetical protein
VPRVVGILKTGNHGLRGAISRTRSARSI